MTFHILNGDALLNQFPNLKGERIICRECMIDGPVTGEELSSFFSQRALFVSDYFNVSKDGYNRKCILEFSKFDTIKSEDEVNLWFEDDLFCQTNLWFCINILKSKGNFNLNLIRPNHNNWNGFGSMNSLDLQWSFDHKICLDKDNVDAFSNLWSAYQNEDINQMKYLGLKLKKIVPRLPEVVDAHESRKRNLEESGRPEQALQKIKNDGTNKFEEVFRMFSNHEAIYGYGDLQVKRMWEALE
tara:strand:+ start:730 stop:1458 length:729 start_codon:yes stop_codon:yes gene_type:complete